MSAREEKGAIELLRELAPAAFPDTQVPLQIGIERDLLARARGAPHEVVAALKAYTGSEAYLQALRPGATRVGVDGQPAGIVSPGAAAAAAEALADRIIAEDGRCRRRLQIAAPRSAPNSGRADVIRSFEELSRPLGRGGRH